jgi:actin related protein 2/3 complex subunit 5
MTPIIERLSTEEQNVLVKYLYKGMASPLGQSHGNGGVLLSWFEKTADIAGQGPIIRYISDRRLL